ncbi:MULTISPECIES: pilus assembly protein TadG-related protein [Arthrobacter]|uniref:Pilus assembly protein TadG-related protein n=2 Tax=Arthrobacter TaxID=1663 RepID=A0ABU9KLT9_9MICC|nr:pilus assembly protein TadG-related protein [Arthrobacter sp. YJM1]MDP5227263.1 pilus assembly protein TadG-related protein [Arthrobacter sp. YJM1]
MTGTASDSERGSVNILALGYLVIALLAAVVLMAASSVYLEHKKLLSLADGAAASAADTFDVAGIGGAGQGAVVRLDDGRVQAASTEYLRRSPEAARMEGVRVLAASGSQDGRTARVTLQALARPPIVSAFLPDGIVLEASSTARARLMR